MKRIIWIVFIFISDVLCAQGNEYSLLYCIEIAHKNISSQIARNKVRVAEKELVVTKDYFLPSLALSNQHKLSTGRVLNPTTYQFLTNRTVYDMNASIGGSMTLFSGFDRVHRVKMAALNIRTAELDIEKTKNELTLEVTRLFLKTLMDKEAIQVCENKVALLEKQEDIIFKKIEYQSATQGDLMKVQADIIRVQVDCASARNELSLDKVSMCELLEINDWEHFDITFDIRMVEPRFWSASDVLANAAGLPQIRKKGDCRGTGETGSENCISLLLAHNKTECRIRFNFFQRSQENDWRGI